MELAVVPFGFDFLEAVPSIAAVAVGAVTAVSLPREISTLFSTVNTVQPTFPPIRGIRVQAGLTSFFVLQVWNGPFRSPTNIQRFLQIPNMHPNFLSWYKWYATAHPPRLDQLESLKVGLAQAAFFDYVFNRKTLNEDTKIHFLMACTRLYNMVLYDKDSRFLAEPEVLPFVKEMVFNKLLSRNKVTEEQFSALVLNKLREPPYVAESFWFYNTKGSEIRHIVFASSPELKTYMETADYMNYIMERSKSSRN